MEWVLSHMEDANFNEPLSQPAEAAGQASQSGAAQNAAAAADPESVMMLVSMGFSNQQAAAALKVCSYLSALLLLFCFASALLLNLCHCST